MTKPASPARTIVYDGACAFCRRQIERIRALDRSAAFTYLPSSAPDLLHRIPQLAGADFNSGLRLVEADRVYVGADAVYQISRRLPAVSWFSWLYRVPGLRQIARSIYAWIAARRYRLAGRCADGTCRVD